MWVSSHACVLNKVYLTSNLVSTSFVKLYSFEMFTVSGRKMSKSSHLSIQSDHLSHFRFISCNKAIFRLIVLLFFYIYFFYLYPIFRKISIFSAFFRCIIAESGEWEIWFSFLVFFDIISVFLLFILKYISALSV